MDAPVSTYQENFLSEDVQNLREWIESLENESVTQEQAVESLPYDTYVMINELLPLDRNRRIDYAMKKDDITFLLAIIGETPYQPASLISKGSHHLAFNCISYLLDKVDLSNETDLNYLEDAVFNVIRLYTSYNGDLIGNIVVTITNKLASAINDPGLSYREGTAIESIYNKMKVHIAQVDEINDLFNQPY